MKLEFASYPDRDGYLRGRMILKHGPVEPGTMLTFVPTVADMEVRHGMVVAVHSDQVDVVWQAWAPTAPGTYEYGELRRKLGIPYGAEGARAEKRRKWDEKKRRRALECKAGLNHGTLGP